MRNLILSVAMIAALAVGAMGAEPKAAETALESAKRYTSLMQGEQPIKAVEEFWEFPEMLQGMFGEHLKRHTPAEREEIQKLLLGFLKKIYANPQIAEMMKKATFGDFQEKAPKDGKTVVTFNVVIADKKLPNTLIFKKIEERWRVVDAAANNGPLLAQAIAGEYEKVAKAVTPLEYIRELARGAP
jgi:ABC-type transporter MlaC component